MASSPLTPGSLATGLLYRLSARFLRADKGPASSVLSTWVQDHHVILKELQQLLFFPHLCFLPILLQFC